MRLGQWVCCLTPGSKAEQAYGEPIIFERHRHRYEFSNAYRRRAEKAGMVMSGRSADNNLVEIVELKDHPWFVARSSTRSSRAGPRARIRSSAPLLARLGSRQVSSAKATVTASSRRRMRFARARWSSRSLVAESS